MGHDLGVSCAALVDATGRRYRHRADLTGFTTPTPGRALFGPAITIAFLPFRADRYDEAEHSFAALFYRAVEAGAAGSVLVLSAGGYPDVSHGGGTKLARVDKLGLAGVLADGRLRDFVELASCDFVTYCRGEATRAGGDVVMPYLANVPIEVGGVTVEPGDHVYMDASGGVVIPAGDLEEILAEARDIEAEDERFRERIKTERPEDARRHGAQER
jgi:regulator of RNase E activity RraA